MTALIYLAAGNSRRFGANKLLHSVCGKQMFRHLLERLIDICGNDGEYRLFVVTQYDEIAEFAENHGAFAVMSEESKKGASFSIKAGLSAAKRENGNLDSAVFFAADQPYLEKDTVMDFLSFCRNTKKGIVCVSSGGETGNPVSFSAGYFPYLENLSGDCGGKAVVKMFPNDTELFEVRDGRELCDIDFRN